MTNEKITSPVRYRVGRSWGVTIVAEEGGKPDRLMGTMQTPEDAALVAGCLNAVAAVLGPTLDDVAPGKLKLRAAYAEERLERYDLQSWDELLAERDRYRKALELIRNTTSELPPDEQRHFRAFMRSTNHIARHALSPEAGAPSQNGVAAPSADAGVDGDVLLSVQEVAELSPGCRCEWSRSHGMVGITRQAEDCPVHPKFRGIKTRLPDLTEVSLDDLEVDEETMRSVAKQVEKPRTNLRRSWPTWRPSTT